MKPRTPGFSRPVPAVTLPGSKSRISRLHGGCTPRPSSSPRSSPRDVQSSAPTHIGATSSSCDSEMSSEDTVGGHLDRIVAQQCFTSMRDSGRDAEETNRGRPTVTISDNVTISKTLDVRRPDLTPQLSVLHPLTALKTAHKTKFTLLSYAYSLCSAVTEARRPGMTARLGPPRTDIV